jgi:hypothetical protein
MPLSWNEIRARSVTFSKEFETETSEDAEAKTFWDAFFNVFGVTRRRIASFEEPVKKSDGKGGYIDLLWKGVLLVEHKSRGKDLNRAYHQATDYFYGLKDRDLPRYVLVSDFARFRLFDLEDDKVEEFALQDLHKKIGLFGFMAGYQTQRTSAPEEVANIKAAEQLGKLHDLLKAAGYAGHPLEVLLVRLLFCLFADDTGIFEKNQFKDYLDQRTSGDGADLGMHLAQFFQVLNTPSGKRQNNLDDQLAAFTYVNGRLFDESLPIPAFDRAMRDALLDACALDWSRISPAIFGSLFQSIMDKEARRNLGAHYTREINILKALQPLLLDGLEVELSNIGTNSKRLLEFQKKLAGMRVLDPACGCGNFLVIAYRELRRLELEVLRRLYQVGKSNRVFDVKGLVFVDVDQFYGIEIEEFPAQIAQVAMWLTDHQMNLQVSEEFGQYFARLPLVKSPNIAYGPENGNALKIDWSGVIKADKLSFIVGNPPFIGAKFLSSLQRTEVARTFADLKSSGLLDYVSCWYRKAADYMRENPRIRAAFVSTSSITQGEQVGVLWPNLLSRGVHINFAHRTFQWSSEARGKASVHCVIIGFALEAEQPRLLFEYSDPKAEAHVVRVSNINPYLVDGPNVTLANRQNPICNVPEAGIGNKPIDGGQYLFTTSERDEFVLEEPSAKPYFRRWIGADEFLYGYERWCLWLGNCSASELRKMPSVMARVEAVRNLRLASKSVPTQKLAQTPTRFHVENMPTSTYLVIPEVTSEKRHYIPIGFMHPETLCSNLVKIVPDAGLYHFGVISSEMHMAWTRAVCGRLESRYRYSTGIVYNNFPWPNPTDKQRAAIESAAQGVIDARAKLLPATLADPYDPVSMPPELVKAHHALDKVVDSAYGKKDFKSEADRVAFMFEQYQRIAAPLDVPMPIRPKSKSARVSPSKIP